MKYVVDHYPMNPNRVTIHLTKRIAAQSDVFLGDCAHMSSDITNNPPAFTKKIIAVEGITGLSICGYEVGMTKGLAFDWEDILPEIIIILADESPDGGITEKTFSSKESFLRKLLKKILIKLNRHRIS